MTRIGLLLCVSSFVLTALFSLTPQTAFASDTKVVTAPCPSPQNPTQLCNPIKYANITAFLLAILDVVVQYGALIVVFFIVFSGFKFVTAQGNPEKISEARKMLTWVIIGAFVLLGVYVIRAAICGTLNQLAGTQMIDCKEQFTPR